jgi:hypothetical protein
MTSRGAAAGKAATGKPLASASSSTRPKVSVRLGNTKTSAAAPHLDQERMELLGVSLEADDMDVRVVVRLREGANVAR